jgi:hypothetical protein
VKFRTKFPAQGTTVIFINRLSYIDWRLVFATQGRANVAKTGTRIRT